MSIRPTRKLDLRHMEGPLRNLADRSRGRRPAIQWHDNGTVPRVPALLSDDAPPYRALGLAAVLGLISMAAVVAAIQYQRSNGFPEVGPLVETAQASTAGLPPKRAALVEARPLAEAKPPAEAKPAVQAQLLKPTPATEAKAAAVAPKSAAAQPAAAETETSGRVVAAVTPPPADKADVLAALAKADPQGAKVAEAAAVEAVEPLALLPEEKPAPTPIPQASPRDEDAKVAAIAKPAKREAETNDDAGTSRRVRSSVNLRARPADGSKVLGTIPGGANVLVAANCQHWCAVTYQGKRGFVYKRFLGL